jgi:hypothetical protein
MNGAGTAKGLSVGLQMVGQKFAERAGPEASPAIEAPTGFGRGERKRAMAALERSGPTAPPLNESTLSAALRLVPSTQTGTGRTGQC